MEASLSGINRKPTETTMNHSTGQGDLALIGEVPPPHMADVHFIGQCSFEGAMRYAVQRCCRDDYEVADDMHVSHGQMSKVMRGSAGFFGPRLVRFMRVTGSLAPVQWYADQMGCDLVQRSGQAARIRELEQELARARKAA